MNYFPEYQQPLNARFCKKEFLKEEGSLPLREGIPRKNVTFLRDGKHGKSYIHVVKSIEAFLILFFY